MAMTATVDPIEYMGEGGTGPREDPIYVFAKAVGGETIANIAAFLAVVTMTSMALAGILASSRFPFAMSRDKLMPEFLEEVHGKFGTPYWAIIVTRSCSRGRYNIPPGQGSCKTRIRIQDNDLHVDKCGCNCT